MSALWEYLRGNQAQIQAWAVTTAWLSLLPLLAGLALALPAGWLAHRYRWAGPLLVGGSGILYTIPSLVMFLVLPGLLGTPLLSPANVAVALTVYVFALMARTVADALRSVPAEVMAAAAAMGHSDLQRLRAVQLPLAVPVIASGLRVAAVSNVSLVSVASVIGVSQLGQLFTLGSSTETLAPIVLGLILFAALAVAFDLAILAAARALTPWRKGAAA